MRATELYNLLEQNKEKLTLIDQIQGFPPGFGAELGWSDYWNRANNGEWKLEVLIKVPYAVLQSMLDNWKTAKTN